jgi:hypothetical protein
MYIIASILTTLALDAYYTYYITIRAAKHTLNNLRSFSVSFLAISNN